ncbi:MAG: SwmB domain-containing protein [Bacteroidales bacterium]|jgi:uncharacterized repeat protein (TIGR02059 family)
MRGFFTLLLCLFSFIASAKDYYISSTGNDSSDGLSSSTPWRTISKVNAASSSFNPGDRILFKRNDVFYGTLKISKSGLSGNPITISSYGSGNKPIITGFTTINEWTNNGNGIYSSRLTSESVPNIVTVNGVNTPIGRWPNTGFLSIDSHNSNSSITDSELPSSPDWTGGEVVIRKVNYIYDRNLITSHSGTTLYYKTASDYTPRDGYGYFIQSHIRTLDRLGEWYSDGSTFYMYFGTANPADYVVKVSTLDQLVSFSGNNHILVDNLSFEGGNKYGIQISNSGYITIQNCSIKFTGGMGIYGPWTGSSPYCRIINNTIDNNNNNGIELNIYHTNAIIQNNYISNSGIIAGMGRSGDGTYIGMISLGANSLIQNNIIENSGYIGIHFHGNNTVITQNLVNTFNLIKNDGGGIYTYTGTGTACTGRKVTNNIVLNGKGYGKGVANNQENAHGIYIDDRTSSVVLTDNTVAHCNSSGMYIHNAHELEINRNTLFDNGSGNDNYGSQILFIHDSYSPNDPIKNVTMNNNIFFARYKTQVVLAFCTNSNDISSFGSANYNCYARPLDNSSVARTWSSGWNSASVNRSLSNWQSFTGQDRNSYISPLTFSDPSKIRFEYNASTSNRVVSLNGSYIDVKGTKYDGSITLAPYTSAVLMVDPNPSAPPAVPAYVSSEIKDGAPSILEMTYNLSLANIVPAASSFSVQVNSAARSVSSVSVSGTKVLLTLSSPVAYGNTVTVAYNKPSTNPLQTPAGGQAASLSAQSVTNRIAAPPAPAVPVYVSSEIKDGAPSILEMTYNLSLANIVPAASSFSVQVNSAARSVSSVSVSGTKVLLTLSSPVAYGNTVTVAYNKPSTNPLQTPAGGQAASLSAQSVTNRIAAPPPPPAVPVYVSSEIKNGAPSVIEMSYNLSLASIIPAASAFTVRVNSTARSVSSVSVSGTKVMLTLSSPAAYGNTVTVAYTKPSTNPLQTAAGGQAATISAQSVTNRIAAPPPPPAPVYVSSVVENTAPSVIEITYNLALANIVPAVSAFTVQVNSTTRSISTVSVSGTKVLLSLAIPVAYGNTVTVAYTKPSTNPLQTAAGGQAATISAQSVTNRISQPVSPPAVVTPPPTTPNSPPVPVVNFPERTYSGFIGDISAKGSYDPDMDKLSFSWKTPDNIPVSSNTGEAIQFLAPVIDTKQTYEFALTVSDGKTTQTKTFPITIIPYEPYLEAAEVISVSASDFHSTNHPYNVVDGNITTMWSSKGEEQSLILELKSPFIIHHIKIAFQPGQKSESYFDIYGSNDGENWESILKKAKSCSFSGGIHVFVFPLSKAVTEYSYLKFVGLGNSTDNWNYVSELRIFGYRHKSRTDYEDLIVKLFPNPARDIVNIRIDDPEFNPDFIKILGLDGKIIYSDLVEPGVRDFQIPVNFKHGVYIVQMGTDNITMFTQKLVVSK